MVDPAAGSDPAPETQQSPEQNTHAGVKEAPAGPDWQALASEQDQDMLSRRMLAELERTSSALRDAADQLAATGSKGHSEAVFRRHKPEQLTIRKALLPPVALAVLGCVASILIGLVDVPMYVPHAATEVLPLTEPDIFSPSKFEGAFGVTHQLSSSNTHQLLMGLARGPEHLVYSSGRHQLWMSAENGSLLSVDLTADGRTVMQASLKEEVFAGPGRVLGFAFARSGSANEAKRVYLCNSITGLMSWAPGEDLRVASNRVSRSSRRAPGATFTFVNSVSVSATTGKVYFSASTAIPPPYSGKGVYNTMRASALTAYTGTKTGMLLEYDPSTGHTECLVDKLWFANGVAVAADGNFVLVVESFGLAIWKYSFAGPQAGKVQLLMDHLPGFPDNLYANADKTFWVGLVSRPAKLATTRVLLSKSFRTVMSYLPAFVTRMLAPKVGAAIQFRGDGTIVRVLADPLGDAVSATTGALTVGNTVYLSHLDHQYITTTRLGR